MKKTRIISLILAMAMLVCAFSACTPAEKVVDGTSSAGTSSADTSSAGTSSADTSSADTSSSDTSSAGTSSADTSSAGTSSAGTSSADTSSAAGTEPTTVTAMPLPPQEGFYVMSITTYISHFAFFVVFSEPIQNLQAENDLLANDFVCVDQKGVTLTPGVDYKFRKLEQNDRVLSITFQPIQTASFEVKVEMKPKEEIKYIKNLKGETPATFIGTVGVDNQPGDFNLDPPKVNEVTDPKVKPVINSLSADKTSIKIGEEVTLSWNVTNAASVQLYTPQIYNMSSVDSKTINPNATVNYELVATNDAGSVSRYVTVNVEPAATDARVYQWHDYILEDQMEYNDFHMWDDPTPAGGSTLEYVTDVKHSGLYSLKCTMTDVNARKYASLRKSFLDSVRYKAVSYDVVYGRMYFLIGDDFSLASGESIELLSPNTYNPASLVHNSNGQFVIGCKSSGTKYGSTVLNKGEWYSLGFCYDRTAKKYTIYLNGKEEISYTGLNLNEAINYVRAGAYYAGRNAGTKGSIYIDDVFIDTKPIEDTTMRLYTPSFVGRIGVKAVVIMSDCDKTDKIQATLTSDKGYSKVQYDGAVSGTGREEIGVNLRGIPAATYTFTVKHLSSSGQVKGTVSTSFIKSYDGDPKEYSIDEDNSITYKGEKIFIITSFGLAADQYSEWNDAGYSNIGDGKGWTISSGLWAYELFLENMLKDYSGARNIGPTAGDEGVNDTDGRGADATRWGPKSVLEYINALKDNPGHAWYMWREEPDNWRYASPEVKSWWDLAKVNSPSKLTENLLMGGSYIPGQNGLGARNVMRAHHYPYLNADIYSWDIYPVENEAAGMGFEMYADAMDCSVNWNMDLVPVLANVQTADCTLGKGGGTPTVTELEHMCWSVVVHGAEGLHWYPYSGETPAENFEAMAKFVKYTTDLKEVILGKEVKGKVSQKLSNGGRVDYVTKTDGKDTYIFAVNINRAKETSEFTLSGISASSVEVYGENRTIKVTNGKFSDSFDDLKYHIYKIVK